MLKFENTPINGAYVIQLQPKGDSRGWFSRVYCKETFKEINHRKDWVQLNHSFTAEKGTIRGLHFQLPPFKEIKMVRCITGNIFDVIVDIRMNSPTFLQWFGIELSAENKKMLYIPEGCAHGFQTLEDNTELIYHHTAFYVQDSEKGLRYNDPALDISWKIPSSIISDKDKNHPLINHNFKGI